MTDKVQKIREEVERLKDWNNNVRNSTRHMTLQEEDFNRGKHSSYLEILNFIDSLQEEPVSDDLEKAIEQSFIYHDNHGDDFRSDEQIETAYRCGFETGAKWQEDQLEKNRLAACDRQTEKEAEIEFDFCIGIIENEHRQPTFNDAIKYGMRLQKEQMMVNTTDAMINLPYENKDGGYTHIVDVSRPLPVGKNKIAIIFKED